MMNTISHAADAMNTMAAKLEAVTSNGMERLLAAVSAGSSLDELTAALQLSPVVRKAADYAPLVRGINSKLESSGAIQLAEDLLAMGNNGTGSTSEMPAGFEAKAAEFEERLLSLVTGPDEEAFAQLIQLGADYYGSTVTAEDSEEIGRLGDELERMQDQLNTSTP